MRPFSDRQLAMSRRQTELEQQLLASGLPPYQAERQAAVMVLEEDRQAARATLPRDERGRIKLTPEEAAFDAGLAAAMGQPVSYGNGAEVDNLAAAATPIDMDREFGATSTPKPVTQRVPGPVDSAGYSEPGEAIYDEEEARGYATRTPAASVTEEQLQAEKESGGPYRGGEELPSGRDRDMYERGMVPTFDPRTGQVGYTVAYPQQPGGLEGAPGRLGLRTDLEQPVIDSGTNQPIPGSHKYEKGLRLGPLGQVEVYQPSAAFRQQLKAREDRMRIQRLAERAGMTPDQQVALTTQEGPVNLDALRTRGDALRGADKAARNEARIRRAQALQNPLEYLNRDDISDWNRMVAADAMLRGGYRGATPLDVQQAEEAALALREQRLATGQGFQPRSPQEQELIQQRIDQAKPVVVRAQEHAAAGRLNHPDVLQYANDLVHDNYSSRPGALGVSSHFTDNEVALAAERMAQDLNIPEDQALTILRRIQADRNRNAVASSIVASFYDQ